MEKLTIQELWSRQEAHLEETRTFNAEILREVKTDKARSSLRSLLFLPISTLLFFVLLAAYAVYFAASHLDSWYFIFSGGVVAFFSVLLVVSSIRQLYWILSFNTAAPIVQMQKAASKLKLAVVQNLRIAAMTLPFSPFIGVFAAKVLLGVDIVASMAFSVILSFGILMIALEVVSWFILRALRPKNFNKPWLNWLLQGSGSQVDEAMGFLGQIEDFEQEEMV
jgi:hypothetical protein